MEHSEIRGRPSRIALRFMRATRYTLRLNRILGVAALLAREGNAFGVGCYQKMAAMAAFSAHQVDPRLEFFYRHSLAQHRLLHEALGLLAEFLLSVGHVLPTSDSRRRDDGSIAAVPVVSVLDC
jgi:hypothetical protein